MSMEQQTQQSQSSEMSPAIGENVAHADSNTSNIVGSSINQTKLSTTGKKRAECWDHFDLIVDGDGKKKARGRYCPKLYVCDPKKNGTTSLNAHMQVCKAHPHNKQTKQALLRFAHGDKGIISLTNWKYDEEAIRKALSYFITMDELPFKLVEGIGFKYFMSVALPSFKVPSRFTIQRDCYKIYLEEKSKLKTLLKNSCERICLTTDTWSSIQIINYMCLTAHWIDNDWKLRKRLLNFCPVTSHRGVDLSTVVEKCLVEWGIDKVLTITVDNASSNDVMINCLKKRISNWGAKGGVILGGKYLHMRCIAHIINLIVTDGIKDSGVSVARVRPAVRYVRQSPMRFNKFKSCVEIEKIKYEVGLCLDVSTRWNSTYLMLSAAEKYERAFERYDMEDNIYRNDLESGEGVPTENDWSNARRLCMFLKDFYVLTNIVSGSSYITSNTHLEAISNVALSLNDMMLSNDLDLSLMAKKMKDKYDKYWGSWKKMNMLTYIAMVLDPRYKFVMVQFALELFHKDDYMERVETVKEVLYSLYNEYKLIYDEGSSTTQSIDGNSQPTQIVGGDLKSRFNRMRALSGITETKSDLDKYLREEIEAGSGNVLEYWKVNSSRLPTVSKMARDILAIPITTVASEASFSTGGRVLDEFWSSLTPRIVQCLLCTEDWLRCSLSPEGVTRMSLEEDLATMEELEMDDPDVPQVQHHRAYLKEHVVFKEAIPIKDSSVLSKIHQTYRIGYIKDVILPRILDEATMTSVNSIIHANNGVVISLLKDDTSFIHDLFARMRASSTSSESKRNLVLFLHEFCSLSKSLQLVQQLRLFRDLATEGIFDIITDLLQSQDKQLISTGTNILILFLNQDPNLLRSYVIQQEGNSLLRLLVNGMITDFGEDMHCQFLEIIRILIDSYTMSGSQRDAIIEIFYEQHLDQLIDVIASACPPKNHSQTNRRCSGPGIRDGSLAKTKPEILCNICDLMCFCVLHHPYRIKCNFLMNNAIEKVLCLTRRKEKFLVVAAVRFMRTIISRNDEHLIRHIVKNNLLKPVFEAFIENGNRYNMLHSGVLEFLEYIRKESIKPLITYIVSSFWDQLLKFEHLGTIPAFKLRYDQVKFEQSHENRETKNTVESRKRIDDRALEKEEEDYFNEDSDEEDSASAPLPDNQNHHAPPKVPNGTKVAYSSPRPKSGGLVDYDDDEDDDNYNPPPRKPESCIEGDNTPGDKIPVSSNKPKRKMPENKRVEPEPSKKQRLDQLSNDGEVAACSTCSNSELRRNDSSVEKESSPRESCSKCLSETSGEDSQSKPISGSSPEIAVSNPVR